jgi:adenylosuccinate synthase
LVALRYAVRINGLDELILTKLDVLDAFDEIQVAIAYEREGRLYEELPPAGAGLAGCRPVYRRHPGWSGSTREARCWADLPAAARDYVAMIEHEAGVPVTTVSVGAERDAEVRRG